MWGDKKGRSLECGGGEQSLLRRRGPMLLPGPGRGGHYVPLGHAEGEVRATQLGSGVGCVWGALGTSSAA